MIEEINEQEYIGISEFAKRVNVSKQAVYQQLNKKLKAYLIIENGTKKLNTRAILEVYGKTENQENSKEVGQDLTKALIDSLTNQLTEKDKQLNEKDRQISELHKLMATTQMQLTEATYRLQELTDKSYEETNQEEEKQQDVAENSKDQRIKELEKEIEKLEAEKNRPWWKKIFYVGKM